MTNPTPLYESLVWELRKQILDLGITMQQADDVAGLQSGYLGKMLHAGAPSGRQAGWQLLQYLADAIYFGGFRLSVKPSARRSTENSQSKVTSSAGKAALKARASEGWRVR